MLLFSKSINEYDAEESRRIMIPPGFFAEVGGQGMSCWWKLKNLFSVILKCKELNVQNSQCNLK